MKELSTWYSKISMLCRERCSIVILNSEHKDAYFIYVCDFGGQMCMSLLFEYACITFKCIQNIYNSPNVFYIYIYRVPMMYAFA
jgi:hypothetical protein